MGIKMQEVKVMSLDYYKDRTAISNSMLKMMEESFSRFHKWFIKGEEEEINHNFAGGQYLHSRIEEEILKINPQLGTFEPDYIFLIMSKIDRRTKAGKAEYAEKMKEVQSLALKNPEKEVYLLQESERNNVEAILPIMLNKLKYFDKDKYEIIGVELSGKIKYELDNGFVVDEETGEEYPDSTTYTIKGTCDMLVREIETDRTIIVDWKNTKVYKDWLKKAFFNKYPRPAFMYKEIFGADAVEFIVCDTDEKQIMEVTVSEATLNYGEKLLKNGLRMFTEEFSVFDPTDIEKRIL